MTLLTKGMGAILKNVYKKDLTGKKDILIKSLNKKIKKSVTKRAGPEEVDRYTDIMTSDFEKKTGPYFNHPKVKKAFKKSKGRK
jgi:hypothetical protein